MAIEQRDGSPGAEDLVVRMRCEDQNGLALQILNPGLLSLQDGTRQAISRRETCSKANSSLAIRQKEDR